MKTITIFAITMLVFVGCSSQQSDQLTQQQRDQIKTEVKAVNDSILAQYRRLDDRSSLQYFWDSPEFLYCRVDGSTSDFQTLKSASEWCDSAISVCKITLIHEEFPIVTKDQVVYFFTSNGQVIYKSGDGMNFDKDAQTFVYRKIDGNWKIVFMHESATITRQKAGKK